MPPPSLNFVVVAVPAFVCLMKSRTCLSLSRSFPRPCWICLIFAFIMPSAVRFNLIPPVLPPMVILDADERKGTLLHYYLLCVEGDGNDNGARNGRRWTCLNRLLTPEEGLEPPTRRLTVACSTN